MTITRIEWVGINYVPGPRRRPMTCYDPRDWSGWTVRVEGSAVLFEGEGRRVEVPRGHCVIDWGPDKAPKATDLAGEWVPDEPPKRGPGRPRKTPEPPQAA